MNKETYKNYRDLKIEDFIWFIYFFILIANLYSNKLEEDNYTKTKYTDPKDISKINITILTTVFFVYVYFLFKSYNDYKDSVMSKKRKRIELNGINLFASLLFVIAGLLLIYVESNSMDDNEIGLI